MKRHLIVKGLKLASGTILQFNNDNLSIAGKP